MVGISFLPLTIFRLSRVIHQTRFGLQFSTPSNPRRILTHTPPEARLRLLLVGGVSFPFSFQFLLDLIAVLTEEASGFGMISHI